MLRKEDEEERRKPVAVEIPELKIGGGFLIRKLQGKSRPRAPGLGANRANRHKILCYSHSRAVGEYLLHPCPSTDGVRRPSVNDCVP